LLLRVTLLRDRAGEHVVLLTMHHIATDGWSTGILVRELGTLYESFTRGLPSPLSELSIQYADYAVWQRETMGDEALEPHLAYWREQLKDAPRHLRLHGQTARAAGGAIRCGRRVVRLPRELRQRLAELSRSEGVTLFMTLLAAYQTLLYRHIGQERIPVGIPIANRRRAEVEGLLGFFVNLLVMSTEMGGDPTFRELLRRVRTVALGAYAHQDVPFERLVQTLRQERNVGRAPLVQVTFTFNNAPMSTLRLPNLTITPVEMVDAEVEYDLSLILKEDDEGLGGVLVYNADYLDEARADRLLEHFKAILEQVVAAPDMRLLDLELPGQTRAPVSQVVQLEDGDGEFVFEAEAR
ncbi:MAG: condensation domain-containing protein, partial [Pyrinomonadaceae bacterium]